MPTRRLLVLGSFLVAGTLASCSPPEQTKSMFQLVFPATVKFVSPGTIEVTVPVPAHLKDLLDIRSGRAGKQDDTVRTFYQRDNTDLPIVGTVSTDKNSIKFEYTNEPAAPNKVKWLHWSVEIVNQGSMSYAPFPALASYYGRFDLSTYKDLDATEYYHFESSKGPAATPYRAFELKLDR